MTKFKCVSKEYYVVDTKKVKSKRGNDYQIINCKDIEDHEVVFYDPNICEVEVGLNYYFDLLVTISKYSNVEVLKAWKVENK